MKKLLLICLFGALYFQGKARQFQPIFGYESTQWIMPNHHGTTMESWKVMDTILVVGADGKYKVLEHRTQRFGSIEIGPFGKVRANETNSRLYFMEHRFTTEVLIMDLDLEVGDEFNLITRWWDGREFDHIMVVDSVFVLDGRKHIRFDDLIADPFSGGAKRMFIEGIGPNWGFDPSTLVVCKYDDFIQVFSFENEHIKNCNFLHSTNIGNVIENSIKIHPNPAFEYVVIYTPEMNIYLTVYNLAGISVLSRMLTDYKTVLNLSHLPSNVYFFKFQTPNTKIVKKVIKQ